MPGSRKRDDLPSVSIKDVYRHPTISELVGGARPLRHLRVAPAAATSPRSVAEAFAEVLAEVLDVEQVPVDSHFFDDLGADSMVMARFCARVRKRTDLPSVSIKDVYRHPTIERPGRRVRPAAPAPAAPLRSSRTRRAERCRAAPTARRRPGPAAPEAERRSARRGTSCAGRCSS